MKTRKYRDYIRHVINVSKEVGFEPVEYHTTDSRFFPLGGLNKRAKYKLTLKHNPTNTKVLFTVDFCRWKETDCKYTNKNYWTVDLIEDYIYVRPFSYGEATHFYNLIDLISKEEGLNEIKLWFEKLDGKLKKWRSDDKD